MSYHKKITHLLLYISRTFTHLLENKKKTQSVKLNIAAWHLRFASYNGSLICYRSFRFSHHYRFRCFVTIAPPNIWPQILVFTKKTKHVEIDCHVIRDSLTKGLFQLCMFLPIISSSTFSQNPSDRRSFSSYYPRWNCLKLGHLHLDGGASEARE